MTVSRVQLWPNAKQARKGIEKGHPELMVECPQCHSPVGRTCFMGPGYWGITHLVRRARYRALVTGAQTRSVLPS